MTASKRSTRTREYRYWPGGPHQLCITTTAIIEGRAPVLGVVHSERGDWQFLDGGPIHLERLARACVHHIVDADPTLSQVKGLARGWEAWRDRVGATWNRGLLRPEDDPGILTSADL